MPNYVRSLVTKFSKWVSIRQNKSQSTKQNTVSSQEHLNSQIKDLLRANQLITALSRVAIQVDSTNSPNEVMEILGRELKSLDIICFLALEKPEKQLVIKYSSIDPRTESIIEKLTGRNITGFHLNPANWPIYHQVIEQRETLFREDLLQLLHNFIPEMSQSIIKRCLQIIGLPSNASVIHVPLLVEDQVLGALFLWGKTLFETDLSIFSVFASQVANTLKNAQYLSQISKSEEKFRGLFESAPDAVLIVDKNGRIVLTNKQAHQILGYQKGELINSPVEIVVPESVQIIHRKHREKFTQNPYPRFMNAQYKLSAKHKLGHTIPVEINLSPLDSDNEKLIICTLRDITLRNNRERELELLNEIMSAATIIKNKQELLQVGCTAVSKFFKVPQVALALIEESKEYEIVIAEHLEPGRHSAMNIRIPISENPALQLVMESRQPIAISDVQTHLITAPMRKELRKRGTISLLIVPIPIKDHIIGTLGIDAISPRQFTDREIQMAKIVAEEFGRALETAQLYEQLQQYTADLEEKVDIRTKELIEANQQLQELDKIRSKLVSDVSHELRTPMTSLNIYMKLLESGNPERQKKYIDVLKFEIGRLNHLVEDILELSCLEIAQERRIKMDKVDLNEIVEQVVEAHHPRAESKSIDLSFTPEQSLLPIWGERNQIAQILTNLISNALNYTKEGSVHVSTFFNNNGEPCLHVKDTGMGIESEDLPHIFERFYRGKQQGQSNIPGTGLGLGIVQEIVNLHQGKIQVESNIGKGSTFCITFPPNKNGQTVENIEFAHNN